MENSGDQFFSRPAPAPAAFPTLSMPTASPYKKLKKIIILIAVALGVILVVVAAVLIYFAIESNGTIVGTATNQGSGSIYITTVAAEQDPSFYRITPDGTQYKMPKGRPHQDGSRSISVPLSCARVVFYDRSADTEFCNMDISDSEFGSNFFSNLRNSIYDVLSGSGQLSSEIIFRQIF